MKARRPPLTPQEFRLLALIGLGTLIIVAALVGLNLGLSRVLPGGGGFFSPWAGSRVFLFEQGEPYGAAAVSRAQRLVYGRAARAGEDPLLLDTPFHLMPIYFPFAVLADPGLARGIWMAISEIGLLALALASLRLARWRPRALFLALFLLFSCFLLYAAQAILDGGPQIMLGLLYLAILIALERGRDEPLGGLLALASFKWEIGGLFLLFIFLRLLSERRWRALTTFGMTLALLGLVSFLIYPGWPLPFARATVASLRAYPGITAHAVLLGLWPEGGARLSLGLAGLLVILLGLEWFKVRAGDLRRLVWAACLTLAVAPLLAFRTELANLVILLPGFTLFLAAAHQRWRRLGYVLPAVFLLLVFGLTWAAYLRNWLSGGQRLGLLFLFYPILTIVGLYWTRWWVIHPPQTWMDQAIQPEAR